MVDKIANELLQMILEPLLHVPDDMFSSCSNTAFGCNVKFPTSSLLLVCKRWLKVATPLLYKVVVLRSTAQAQALAEGFSQYPLLPLCVKKIRLEGAYSCLWKVIGPCSNLHTICFTLDIYAVTIVTGLCRSLNSINPTRVILLDRCDTKNVKIEQVFCKLIECIPRWTNLTEFYYPYAQTETWFRGTKPERLAIALSQSTTLKTISAELPLEWDENWSTMATNPEITFKFREGNHASGIQRFFPVIKTIFLDPGVLHKMDPTSLSKMMSKMRTIVDKAAAAILPETSFTPFTGIPLCTAELLWTRILAFATSPGHPDSFNLSHLTDRAALLIINSTRKSLTLVSKQFYRLSQQFLFQVPLFLQDRSLTRLILRCNQDPTILHQVRVLSLYMLGTQYPNDVDFELTTLIPHMIGLEHFVGNHFLTISSTVFAQLVDTAGPTLLTIDHLNITANHAVPESIFLNLQNLTRLDFARSPQIISPPLDLPLNLPTFSRKLVSATIPQDKFMHMSLKICGPTLLNLRVTPGFTKYTDILKHCPKLKVLTWKGRSWSNLCDLLLWPYRHRHLRKINLRIPPLYMTKKDVVAGLRSFIFALSQALIKGQLPSLREVRIAGYTWPIEERDIDKDVIVKHAILIKTNFSDVNIIDDRGQPWRLRAERRQ